MDIEKIKIAIDTGDLQRAKNELDKVEKSAKSVDKGVSGLTNSFTSLRGVVATVAGAAVISNFIRLSDAATRIDSRLNLATKSTKEFAKAQTELFNIAQNTRSSFESTVELYAKLSTSTEDLNISQERLLKVTDAINKAGIIGGGSQQGIDAALMQLGQAFSKGILGGEELNSILEQTPRLAKAIAEGLGVSVGELKKLGEQGDITGKKLFNALESQTKNLDKDFEKVGITFEQSMTKIETSSIQAVKDINEITGASKLLNKAINSVSIGIDEFSQRFRISFQDTDKMNNQIEVMARLAKLYAERKTVSDSNLNILGLKEGELTRLDAEIAQVEKRYNELQVSASKEKEDDSTKKTAQTEATNEKILIDLMDERSQKIAKIKKESADLRKEGGNVVLIAEREAKAIKDLNAEYDKKSLDEQTRKQEENARAVSKTNEAYLEMSRVGMSEYDKALSEIQEKTKEWIKTTGNKAEALKKEAVLIAELNKKRDDEVAKQALELERQRNEQIDKRITSLNREYDLKEKQVGLIYDETERNQALTKLYYERRVQEIELEKQKKDQSDEFYESQLSYEKNLLDQTLFRYSATGQIIESVSSGMKSTMMDFFDYTSAGFGDLKKMALDLGNIIYKAVIQQMVVNPLVGALSSAATSYFATPTPTTTGGGTYNGVTSTAFKWDGGISDGTTIKKFASGYIAGNRYASTDSLSNDRIPALISPGEAVIPASSVNQNRDLVQALISNRGRKFADGYIAPSVSSPGGGNGVVKVEVINQSNQEVQVTNTSTRQSMEGLILSVVINGIQSNKMGLRTALGK